MTGVFQTVPVALAYWDIERLCRYSAQALNVTILRRLSAHINESCSHRGFDIDGGFARFAFRRAKLQHADLIIEYTRADDFDNSDDQWPLAVRQAGPWPRGARRGRC